MSCPIKSVSQTKQTSFKLVQHDYKNKWMEMNGKDEQGIYLAI